MTFYQRDTQDHIPTGVRLPPDLHKELKKIAFKDDRTFNSMLIVMLRNGMKKTTIDDLMAELAEIKTFCLEIKQFIEMVKPKEVRNTSLILSAKSANILASLNNNREA